MNIFELSAVANPIVGVVVGIRMTHGDDMSSVLSAIIIGLTVGMAIHCVIVILGRMIDRLLTITDRGKDLTYVRVALDNLPVFLAMLAPIATALLTIALVKRMAL